MPCLIPPKAVERPTVATFRGVTINRGQDCMFSGGAQRSLMKNACKQGHWWHLFMVLIFRGEEHMLWKGAQRPVGGPMAWGGGRKEICGSQMNLAKGGPALSKGSQG